MKRLTTFLSLALLSFTLHSAHSLAENISGSTKELIQTLRQAGIQLTINGIDCKLGIVHGSYIYNGMRRAMLLCPGETFDPIDHATVRHETWHAIQHCINVARGTDPSTPAQNNPAVYNAYISSHLSAKQIAHIKSHYPEEDWLLEMEALFAQNYFTTEKVTTWFRKSCTFDRG